MPELMTHSRQHPARVEVPESEMGLALHLLSQSLTTAGRFEEARQSLELSLDLLPGQPECHFDLANIFYASGKLERAINEYRRAIRLAPDMASAWYNLGVALMQSGELEAAEHAYRRTVRFSPKHAEAHNNLGILLQSVGKTKDAILHYRAAGALRPDFPEPRFNLGCLLQDTGRLVEARQVFETLLADCPGHTEAMNNLANVLTELGLDNQARDQYEQILLQNPSHALSRWNLGLNQLRTGDWTAGWNNYQWRLERKARRSERPLWNGRNLEGSRILLLAEQGLGDLVQFVRFMPQVSARGGRVWLECHRSLKELFARLPEVEGVIEIGDELPEHDCWLPLMSVPAVLGTTLETLPAKVPYLSADPARRGRWHSKLDSWKGMRAGLVWSGNTKFRVNAKRSLSGHEVRQICRFAKRVEGGPVHLFSLQKGVPVPAGCGLIALDDDPTTLDDLAAVMMNLDLIVTVDTSVAHLAGALGLPVWTMLAFHADWRWMTQDRDESPWYPTMRLLRQTRPGDWSNVMAQVEAGFEALRKPA